MDVDTSSFVFVRRCQWIRRERTLQRVVIITNVTSPWISFNQLWIINQCVSPLPLTLHLIVVIILGNSSKLWIIYRDDFQNLIKKHYSKFNSKFLFQFLFQFIHLLFYVIMQRRMKYWNGKIPLIFL